MSVIKQGQVEDASRIYELLDGKISNDAKQALLELLCYSNSMEMENAFLIEEKWLANPNDRIMWK